MGPSGGSGVAVLGEGAFRISASPSNGQLALPLLPVYAAWYDAGLLAASPGRAQQPPGRTPLPDLVPVAPPHGFAGASVPEPKMFVVMVRGSGHFVG